MKSRRGPPTDRPTAKTKWKLPRPDPLLTATPQPRRWFEAELSRTTSDSFKFRSIAAFAASPPDLRRLALAKRASRPLALALLGFAIYPFPVHRTQLRCMLLHTVSRSDALWFTSLSLTSSLQGLSIPGAQWKCVTHSARKLRIRPCNLAEPKGAAHRSCVARDFQPKVVFSVHLLG